MAQALQVIDATFGNRVEALSEDWREVEAAYETLAEKQLRFALSVRRLYEEAKKLDGVTSKEHMAALRQKVQEIIRSDNKSILSRWNTIAEHAERFLPYVEQLPVQRDSLYALAVSVSKHQPVEEWIEQGLLRSDMTVREVNALTSGKINVRAKSTAKMDRLVNVTLSFSSTYEEVADLLAELVKEDSVVRVNSGDALRETFKSKLGKSGYARVERKFS